MSRQNSIVTLLGPADPARDLAVPMPRYTAEDLIHHAEAAPGEPAGPMLQAPAQTRRRSPSARSPRRRLSFAAGAVAGVAVAVSLVAALVAGSPTADGPAPAPPEPAAFGPVVVPIAYEVATDPEPAADQLRQLAASLVEAPYEQDAGQYAYHRTQSWGDAVQTSPDGHVMSYVEETERWAGADGTIVQRHTVLGAQFPNEDSRRFWQGVLGEDDVPDSGPAGSVTLLPEPTGALPTDRAGLVDLLHVAEGPAAATQPVVTAFAHHLVPRPVRADILEILADTGGFVWRGDVTDRSGRAGVAISYDDTDHAQRHVLVFDPGTGVLLAHELVSLAGDPEVAIYSVLEYGHADERPEAIATTPAEPSPPAGPNG